VINEPPILESRILELDAWNDIIHSENWKYFVELMDEHCASLENQVLIAVRNNDFDKSRHYSARADECRKIIILAESRLGQLKERK